MQRNPGSFEEVLQHLLYLRNAETEGGSLCVVCECITPSQLLLYIGLQRRIVELQATVEDYRNQLVGSKRHIER